MVEVPEYLLERSRQRRLELTGSAGESPAPADAPAPAQTAAASAPAVAAAPAALPEIPPAPPPPPPPKPKPWIQAALSRNKIPYWVMPVLLFLPIWAYIYVGTLEEPTRAVTGIIAEGQEVFQAKCAACHTASGGGSSSGPKLSDGEVLLTFPDDAENLGLAQHVHWVLQGTNGIGEGNPYGAPERERTAGWFANMPGHAGDLSAREILAVVLYERVTHGASELAATLAPITDDALNAGTLELPENFSEETSVEDTAAILAPLQPAGEQAAGEGES